MKIAITGAGGLIGRHLAEHLAAEHKVVALMRDDLDITDRQAVMTRVFDERPDVIINCAVIGVDDCEMNPRQAWAVNVAGPQTLAEAAAKIEAEFLHFSSNYVFDGKREDRASYTIEDEPNPINVYGRTKLAGERAVRAFCPRSFIVRTSWVFGTGKESFLSTAHRDLLKEKRLRAIYDVWASATFVTDLAARTKEILAKHHYATYHVVNDGVCSYYDFALEAARHIGMTDADVERLIWMVSEEDMRRLAPRPRYTPMRCTVSEELGLRPMRDWRAALADYVNKRSSQVA